MLHLGVLVLGEVDIGGWEPQPLRSVSVEMLKILVLGQQGGNN
jgi:hypothetical protein